jgi:hypothetical protein
MQFHPTGTDPAPAALVVCRSARWNLLILLAIFWAIPTALLLASAPIWAIAIAALLPALLTSPLVGVWRKRGRPDNWVLALHGDGLWLNLRDVEYHAAEPGSTIVFLPYDEIPSAQPVIHRYTTPTGNGKTRYHRDIYLELRTKPQHVAELRDAIAAEWKRELPRKQHLGGMVTSHSRRTNSPLEIEGDNAVRIKFSSSTVGLRPSINRVLDLLHEFVKVEEASKPPLVEWRELTDTAFEEFVHRLAVSGQKINAMELLRRRRGMSTTEAKHHVDKLKRAATASTAT